MNAADSHEIQRHGYNAQNGRQGQDEDHQPDPEPVHSSCTIGTASFVSAIAGCSGGTSDTSDRNTAVLKQIFLHGRWVFVQNRHLRIIVECLEGHERMEYMEYWMWIMNLINPKAYKNL